MNGLEVEVRIGERWVEVLECGEIHPWLLNESNLPSQKWSGLARGIGLDRLVMLIKQIDDIRLLRSIMLPPYLRLRSTARASRIRRTARFVEGRFAAVMLRPRTAPSSRSSAPADGAGSSRRGG